MDDVVKMYQAAEVYVRAFHKATKGMSDEERDAFKDELDEWNASK